MDVDHQRKDEYNLGAIMARYRGPRARICRRLDFPVFESPKFSRFLQIFRKISKIFISKSKKFESQMLPDLFESALE